MDVILGQKWLLNSRNHRSKIVGMAEAEPMFNLWGYPRFLAGTNWLFGIFLVQQTFYKIYLILNQYWWKIKIN